MNNTKITTAEAMTTAVNTGVHIVVGPPSQGVLVGIVSSVNLNEKLNRELNKRFLTYNDSK